MKGQDLKELLDVEFTIKNNNVYCSDKNVNSGFINEIEGYIISYCEKK